MNAEVVPRFSDKTDLHMRHFAVDLSVPTKVKFENANLTIPGSAAAAVVVSAFEAMFRK
jgi:hypothetical protein